MPSSAKTPKRASRTASANRRASKPRQSAAAQEVLSIEKLAHRLANVAPNEDPARVAGAIAIFATRTIERSATNLREARAYLDGLRGAIDGLLRDRFTDSEPD